MKISPTATLVASTMIVGMSTALFPFVTGYGTVLFQNVVLGAWAAIARVSSDIYADRHHAAVWLTALVFNLALFVIPAAVAWLVFHERKPLASSLIIVAWCTFYVACLFVLFPATDGP